MLNRVKYILMMLIPIACIGVIFLYSDRSGNKRADIIPPETWSPEVVAEMTPVPTPMLVPSEAPTPTPTMEVTPTPTPTPVIMPDYDLTLDPGWKSAGFINLSIIKQNEKEYPVPTMGITQMSYYLRSEPGRTAERMVRVPRGTQVSITYSCTNMFNEPWYGIRTEVDGVSYEGYVQQSTTQVGDYLKPTPMPVDLIHVPRSEVTERLVTEDRNGDGVYVVVLDPGHGGSDSGAVGYSTNEKDINLKTAQYCCDYLMSHYDNVLVYLTRNGDYHFDSFDTDDDLEYRARYAVDLGADVVVCLHYNAYDGVQRGSMALIPRKPNVYEKDRQLATFLLEEIDECGLPSNGIMRKISPITLYEDGTPMDGYLMLRLTAEQGIPATIIEHCYIDNRKDRQYWNTDEKLESFGIGDAKAIARFLGLSAK